MAFGINKNHITEWKHAIDRGEIAFLTHYWLDDRFPDSKTVTKVGAKNLEKLAEWGKKYQLKKQWIHIRKDGYSHYDLLGETQILILEKEGLDEHLIRFQIIKR
ncbi:hypothetical protein E2R51_04210 [Jeotgalibacillus sp. S-D1]|uniref:hypothetical protein n=1 Tax=Jeotgalibacillus sp. S-D1 TaxID=2552189 RepID=UPI0010595E8E|nr:hypothetical protein [Jeotgalibacillus sp. S-D1]TDL34934.1 hypothetical protein E2R51_04210 [Jeotgalibacillus sp. S-D1]